VAYVQDVSAFPGAMYIAAEGHAQARRADMSENQWFCGGARDEGGGAGLGVEPGRLGELRGPSAMRGRWTITS
jgi:hypothetical protein